LYFIKVVSKEHALQIKAWINDLRKMMVVNVREDELDNELHIQSFHKNDFPNKYRREFLFRIYLYNMAFFQCFYRKCLQKSDI